MRYLFEAYVLDLKRRELQRGDTVLSIEPQVFDLLAYLIQHRDRVVCRDDLLTHVWQGRSISDSTFTSRINSARGAISDSGEDQRLIRTIPRKGYRFVGSVREQQTGMELARGVTSSTTEVAFAAILTPQAGDPVIERSKSEMAPLASQPFHVISLGAAVMLYAAATVAAVAVTSLFFLWPGTDASRIRTPPSTPQRFQAAIVPLVTDEVRRTLARYPDRPDIKALAIARDGWAIADGAPDIETASKEALRQCAARAKTVCRVYARGTDVVWPREALPLPALSDLRSEPLTVPLNVDDIPTLNSGARREIAQGHVNAPDHKALALTTRGWFWVNDLPTISEPARLAVERCTEMTQRPCLLLAVDGFLTIQIPKSRQVTRIFLPSIEAEISTEDKERIGRIYQGHEWRALARGKKGTWHAVAGAPSEAAAIEDALRSCSQADNVCQLYAIGNFRVAEQ